MTKRIFIDCTDTYIHGLNTGIQRVVRSVLTYADSAGREVGLECIPLVFYAGRYHPVTGLNDRSVRKLIYTFRHRLNDLYFRLVVRFAKMLPEGRFQGFLVAPRQEPGLARLIVSPVYFLVRLVTRLRSAAKPASPAPALPVEVGDIVFLPDASWSYEGWSVLSGLKERGARLVFFVHDLIPLTHPHLFQPAHVARFAHWFEMAASVADGFICNSQYSKKVLCAQISAITEDSRKIPVSVVLLGHDYRDERSQPLLHRRLAEVFSGDEPKYLCVGTLEPRKNHRTLLDAFEILWAANSPARLILIGRVGWLSDDIVSRVTRHREFGLRLFWFSDVDDVSLAAAYHNVNALIFPSVVEGFGLPIVEALSRSVPVVASDIEVFREIASGYARFFPPDDARALADVLTGLSRVGVRTLQARAFDWPNWEKVTRSMLAEILHLVNKTARG